ncbi:autotransporter-associated beta strand repeat-containing protein [Luteolibacter yonseiensis]|uniref:Autotransporter-associated beta strand repeat-containing protein n=1 Tax=Luteolibacter yonseiensis TaxID=1144680 RepID=A0A934V8R5_9BACT|nr:autotransporter-associated beta strand repeat-containing protein [Luteolibacter yonseiensis]MBK1817537.1 autotransporter-associated beta strand repeat-containing protein [Luteolibacter yonseiensis]
MKPKNRLKFSSPKANRALPRLAHGAGSGVVLCFAGLSMLSGQAIAGDATWNVIANAFTRDWNANANWTPNTTFPNGVGEIATMDTKNITGGVTQNIVNLNVPITVGQLLLGDTNNTAFYSIRAGTAGSLIFDNTGTTNAVLTDSATAGTSTTNPDNITANIVLNDSIDITTNSTNNTFTITGNISEGEAGKSVTKKGAGILAFQLGVGGANSYTGTTTIENGTLRLTGASSAGAATSAIALGNATSIASNLNVTLRINGATVLARDVTVGASDAVTTGLYTIDTDNGASAAGVSGNIALNQNLMISGATSGGFAISGNITSNTANTRTLTFGGSANTVTASGVIGGGLGTIDLVKVGAGTTRLTGTNTYTGTTTVNGGILAIWGAGTLNAGSYAGNIANAGSFRYESSAAQTLSGVISGAGGLVKNGTGTLTLTGANEYTGGTAVTSGIVIARHNNAFGASGQVTQTSRTGAVHLEGGISIPSSITFLTSNDGTTVGAVGYSINNASGDNTINGTIRMTSGGGGTVIQSTSGTLTLAGEISSDSPRSLTLQGASSNDNTVSGVISNGTTGLTGVTKAGTGTWVLTAANTYTGETLVSAGTLLVNGSLGETAVNVNGGTLGGTGTIAGSVTVGAATYSPGASPGSLEIADNLTLGSGTITSIELGGTDFTLNGTEQYDRTKLTGASSVLTLAGTLAVSMFGGFTIDDYQAFGIFQLESGASLTGAFDGLAEGALVGTFGGKGLFITYQGDFGDSGPVAITGGNDVVLYSIPEPGSAGLAGLAALMFLRRRRR